MMNEGMIIFPLPDLLFNTKSIKNQKEHSMNKIKISIISVLLLSAWMSTGCEGPAGPVGPEGPPGAQGEQGLQGEQGNANIIYSDWMEIEWAEGSTDTSKELAIPESQITSEYLDSGGLVLMYMKIDGEAATLVYALPMLNATGQFQYSFVAIDSDVAFGGAGFKGVIFILRSLDGSTPIPDEIWMNLKVRYVLIPANNNLAGKGIDLGDYGQLIRHFNIEN